jgi:hypothetical protein
MRLDRANANVVEITLSVRNCLALASKGQRPDSMRTLEKSGDEANWPLLIVHVEDDATHYDSRGYRPGEVVAEDDPDAENN